MTNKLLVIARHWPSVLLAKGEYTPRYYNPDNLFDEVHLLLTNSDSPDLAQLQKAVGTAKLIIHNHPRPDFRLTLGWRPWLIKGWIKRGLKIAQNIQPQLIRVHNNFLEGYLGLKIKEALNIPYIVSIHHSEWQFHDTLPKKVLAKLLAKYEKESLQKADAIIAVYLSNLEYAQNMQGADPRLIYNVVSDAIPTKKNYKLSHPPKIITINQQKEQKDPSNIMRAIVDIDCEYLIVGNGPIHQDLLDLADRLGLNEKVTFSTGIPNDELTSMLPDFDLHVSHCDVWGMSKTVVESSLAALPTLINYHPERPIPEFSGDWLFQCENTPEAYREKILAIIADQSSREKMGKRAHQHAMQEFDPRLMEKKMTALYKEKMI